MSEPKDYGSLAGTSGPFTGHSEDTRAPPSRSSRPHQRKKLGKKKFSAMSSDRETEVHPLLLDEMTDSQSNAVTKADEESAKSSKKKSPKPRPRNENIRHGHDSDGDVASIGQAEGEDDDDDEDGAGFIRTGSAVSSVENSVTNWDTIIHLLKGNIGTGILAMPDAIKNSGLLIGNIGLVFMSIICVHCMHMLIRCSRELAFRVGKPKLNYAGVAENAFGTAPFLRLRRFDKFAACLINTFLCITQLGFCCVYFVFCAKNIKLVADHHFGERDYHLYMLMLLLPMLALCSIRDLKRISPISFIATGLQLAGLVMIFSYLLHDMPKSWDRKYVAKWSQYPLYFGTAIYAFEGIGVVLPVENKMRNPSDMVGWDGVLNFSMSIVSVLYIAVGFFGYLKYGDAVEASITLNLPVEETFAQVIIFMFAVAIFLSYALQFYVPIEIAFPYFERKYPDNKLFCNYLLRYSTVLVTFALAAAIPCLDLFISLVGSASSSTLALMAPPILDTLVFWDTMTKKMVAKNVAIFSLGFLGFVTGSWISLQNIADFFKNGR